MKKQEVKIKKERNAKKYLMMHENHIKGGLIKLEIKLKKEKLTRENMIKQEIKTKAERFTNKDLTK